MNISLTFHAKEVLRAFKEMKLRAQRANAKCLKYAMVTVVERDAKKLYGSGHPGTKVDTNRLRSSIHTEATDATGTTARVMTGTNVEYAYFQHEGFHTRGGGRFVEGHPFLVGPLEALGKDVLARYCECMKRELGL